MHRLSIKLEPGLYQGAHDTYAFHIKQWRVIKCWPVNPRVTAPVTVRRHAKGAYVSNRLLIMTPHAVEPGTIVEPYALLCEWLAARPTL